MDSGGPKEACVRWVHIGDTWQIRLNHLCVAVMRRFVKLLWPLVPDGYQGMSSGVCVCLFISLRWSDLWPRYDSSLHSICKGHWSKFKVTWGNVLFAAKGGRAKVEKPDVAMWRKSRYIHMQRFWGHYAVL